jgi:integrase/recombinase XerD
MKITKLNNGTFRTQVYDQYGKRHRKIFLKRYEAEAYVKKIMSDKNDVRLIHAKIIKSRVTFEKAIKDFWTAKINLAPKTVVKYKAELDQIDNFRKSQGLEYVDEFERSHADTFKALLIDSGASPKTINSYLMRMKSLFIEQVNRDTIVRDPTSHLTSVPRIRKTMLQRDSEYYTEDEIRALFHQEIHPKYRRAFLGLYLTGMRFEELANLTYSYLDMKKRLIQVRSHDGFRTKTATSERDIPISDFLFETLNETVPGKPSDYVFHSKSGRKLSERTLLAVCKRVAKNAGITKVATLHKFRHTFSSLLSQMGIAYEVREYLLGHKPTGSLTGHYTKLTPYKYHHVVSLLDGIIK